MLIVVVFLILLAGVAERQVHWRERAVPYGIPRAATVASVTPNKAFSAGFTPTFIHNDAPFGIFSGMVLWILHGLSRPAFP